ncbi:MAG TPA: Rrf2 family transcriptional regulator [Chitinophagaceae bacterium]|nr:Rrf2 family transcriptional regulator [Chitinophagaceae bacterium]
MLSKKTRYALKALVVLARNYGHGPMLISALSKEETIPKKFLEGILLELRNAGILGSKKGAGGGYYLLKPPGDVMVSEVFRKIGGPIALIPCVSLNFYERCEECRDEATCGIRDMALQVRDATLEILTRTSLADVMQREDRLRSGKKRKKP